MKKSQKGYLITVGLLFLMLIVVIPLINIMFIDLNSVSDKFNAFYNTRKSYMIVTVLFAVFLFLARDKAAGFKPDCKQIIAGTAGVIVLAILLFAFEPGFYPAIDGGLIRIGDRIEFDALFGLDVLADRREVDYVAAGWMEKRLEGEPAGNLRWLSYWVDVDGNGFNSQVIMDVNGKEHDITPLYSQAEPGRKYWLNYELKAPVSSIIISASGPDRVFFATQYVYRNHDTTIMTDNGLAEVNDAVMYISNGQRAPIIYRYKSYLLIGLSLLLFYALFGNKFFRKTVRKARAEAIASVITTVGFFYFWSFIREYWRTLSLIVSQLALRVFSLFTEASLSTAPNCPALTVSDFTVMVCEGCSGIDSLSFFTIFFLIVFIARFRQIDPVRGILAYALGLAGAMLLNLLRVIIIISVGVVVSQELALTLFHSMAGWLLFIVYTFLYGYLVFPRIKK
ncbi:MAG: exosortase/archaeosortase family protein [archaeon]